ncbi:MAG: ornithine carbamoyltransferase [Alphaproteobacteria bacterium HGW-Alphaproteobacteria-11]|nr:MAG: ornithine carbamoyltransferase [Alphaproteobacteria bacterium HGW-Alphaproteobacteria-11]
MSPRHFLDLHEVSPDALRAILDDSRARKLARNGKGHAEPDADKPLKGKLLAMIFEKPSTRTRVSFDVAMRQLGGETLLLNGGDMQLGRGETVADTARVLSRYVDAIMIRTADHENLMELAAHASVPVVNGLTNLSHPCQLMADVMTFEEHKGPISGRRIAWVGDGNNMATSWIHAAGQLDFELRIACPPELAPSSEALAWAKKRGAKVHVTADPREAVAGVDCINTDTWVSMSDDAETAARRHNLLAPYRVDARLMAAAGKGAIFMHCLPAHRDEEMTADVIDGPASVVFDEAENRLHAQKGVLAWCFQ